ncbi:MAG: DHH family phosphoesterase [Candidatus Brocadiaceae bacterium]
MTEPDIHRAIWQRLTDGLPAVVTSHVRLDGDGIGSALAIGHALRRVGVDSRLVLQPPVPSMFDFLPGMDGRPCTSDGLPDRYNLLVVDCGNFERVGELRERLTGRACMINLDHHDSNTFFGDLNYVDKDASSCGEMVRRLFATVGVPITREIADCLFAAVVSDTGQFAHEDTTAAALEVCAECVNAGARPHVLVRKLFMSPSPAQVRLRQLALGTLQFHCDGSVATMQITEDMFEQTRLGPVDTEGFAEIPISIQGVEASALLKEMPGCGYIKVSMRSRAKVDVCEVAGVFGGGGHKHAAGCEIADTLENALHAVVKELQRRLVEAES